jgi:hypothetical protein
MRIIPLVLLLVLTSEAFALIRATERREVSSSGSRYTMKRQKGVLNIVQDVMNTIAASGQPTLHIAA